jgi:hypothetical protein
VPYSDMAAHPNDYYIPTSLPLPLKDPYTMEYDDAASLISHLRRRDTNPAFEFYPYSVITSNISKRGSSISSRHSTPLADDSAQTGAKDGASRDLDESEDRGGDGTQDMDNEGSVAGDGKQSIDGSENGDGEGNDRDRGNGDANGDGNGGKQDIDGSENGDSDTGKKGGTPVFIFDEDDRIDSDDGDNGSEDEGNGSEDETDEDGKSAPVRAGKATRRGPATRKSTRQQPPASQETPEPPARKSTRKRPAEEAAGPARPATRSRKNEMSSIGERAAKRIRSGAARTTKVNTKRGGR